MQIAQKNFYKKLLGKAGEKTAEKYLSKNGYTVLETNYRTHLGEIDIIGIDKDCMVFFEVKYRKDEKFGSPLAAITKAKQKKIIGCANYYTAFKKWNGMYRFDAIGITQDKIEWIKNAFC